MLQCRSEAVPLCWPCHKQDVLNVEYKIYCCSWGTNMTSFRTVLLIMPLLVFTVATRTNPSDPRWMSITQPINHRQDGKFSSLQEQCHSRWCFWFCWPTCYEVARCRYIQDSNVSKMLIGYVAPMPNMLRLPWWPRFPVVVIISDVESKNVLR